MKAYYRDLHTLHTHVRSAEKKGAHIVATFDDTLFYPGGGGQPHDIGRIDSPTFAGIVTAVDETGEIMHTIEVLNGTLAPGMAVTMHLDVGRRESLVRMHTGEHILFKAIQTFVPDALLDKIDLGTDESKLFIFCKQIGWEELFKAEALANKVISENRHISEREHSKEEALKLEGLRIKPERIPGDTVRVIKVDGYDLSACRGVHAHNTGFVGSVLVTHFSRTAKGAELRFVTAASGEAFRYAGILRTCGSLLGVPAAEVPAHVARLQNEIAELKAKYRETAGKLALACQREQAGRVTLCWNVTSGVEKKQLSDTAAKLCGEMTVVLLINSEDSNSVVLATHPSTGIDSAKLLTELLSHFGGKGGGRDRMAMGSFSGSVEEFLKLAREKVERV